MLASLWEPTTRMCLTLIPVSFIPIGETDDLHLRRREAIMMDRVMVSRWRYALSSCAQQMRIGTGADGGLEVRYTNQIRCPDPAIVSDWVTSTSSLSLRRSYA